MGTCCQLDCSDEDDKMLDESRNFVNNSDHENFEKAMPAIKAALAERCVMCLEENAENVRNNRNNINEQIAQKGEELTDIDKLDQEVLPTHQQLDEMVKIGQELGISEPDIIAIPLICGTPGVKDMDGRIRDVMEALHISKIPSIYRDDVVISKIMFVDKQVRGITGLKRADFNPLTGVMHIYRNAEGNFPGMEEMQQEVLPHEIFHANKDELMGRIRSHPGEWTAVTALETKFFSPYIESLDKAYNRGEITREQYDNEIAAELYTRYITNKSSEETSELLDKCFSEEEDYEEE